MSDEERNPHLPERPADGKHKFEDKDGHKTGRCVLCGAYGGSAEAVSICKGEYSESGKMRSWAASEWLADKLAAGGTPRRIIQLITREIVGVRDPGISYGGITTHVVLLECGHEREIDYETHQAVHWGRVTEASCVAEHCPMKAREDSRVLNGRDPLTGERVG